MYHLQVFSKLKTTHLIHISVPFLTQDLILRREKVLAWYRARCGARNRKPLLVGNRVSYGRELAH